MNIALCGLGRAGKRFVNHTLNDSEHDLVAVLCREESDTAGKSVTDITNIQTPKPITVQRISEFQNSEKVDVVIDFSNNPTTFSLLDMCCKYGISLVICPTNFTDEETANIKRKAEENNIGVVFAPTLTVGINMLLDFVKKFSKVFPQFDFEIVEKHPKNKARPTKTAKIIADSIGEDVNISSVRLDGYVGVHEVIATNGIEKISITHQSFNRAAFANGALIAADFIKDKKGYYEMSGIIEDLIREQY